MIYHIAQKRDWEEAIPNQIYICESLETQGFIHCSYESQILRVANAYYPDRKDLVILAISEDELTAKLKVEKAVDVDDHYPHIYGPLNMMAIKRVITFKPDSDGKFTSLPEKLTEKFFWQTTPLSELSKTAWESLCDGCARCCLYKIQDIDTEELFYTNVACKFLNPKNCQCTDYKNRHEIMPTCIILTPEVLDEINWMPATCAYRLLAEGKDLAWWHPLVTGKKKSTRKNGFSIANLYIPEQKADLDNLQNYVIEDTDYI